MQKITPNSNVSFTLEWKNKRENSNGMQKLYPNGSGPLRKVFNPIFLSSERSGTPEEKRKGTFICIIALLSYFFVFWFFEWMHSNSLKCERLFYRIWVRLKIGDYQFCYMNVLWHVKYCVLIMGFRGFGMVFKRWFDDCISNFWRLRSVRKRIYWWQKITVAMETP